MSLTELAFILFFLLLLLAIARDMSKQEELDSLKSIQKALQDSGLSDDEFRKLVRSSATVAKLEEEKRLLEAQLAKSEEELEETRQTLAETQQELAEARSALAQAMRATNSCKGQLAVLRGQCGVGFPPCWVGAENRIEYLYRINIHEDHLAIEPTWPEYRERELDSIPGARGLIGESVSLSDLRGPAETVLKWSKDQDPECRHYVILGDRATTKDGYKGKRLTIENYFYKLESRQ